MEKTGWKPTKLPDKELIKKARNGEQEAFFALVEKYRKGLLAYIREYLSGIKGEDRGVETAEQPQDICQETFQKAFLHIKEYNPDYEFSTWLFNIGRNTAIDCSRKRRTPPGTGLSPEMDSVLAASQKITGDSPEDKMISNQEYESLIRHIGNLGPLYREVAQLRFIHEFAYEEIAKELELPLNTVRTRLKRAKELLLKKWKN